jgi:hypothetical protein
MHARLAIKCRPLTSMGSVEPKKRLHTIQEIKTVGKYPYSEGDKALEEAANVQWSCRATTTRAKNIATDTFVEEMRRKREEQGFTGHSSHTDTFSRSKSNLGYAGIDLR